MSTKYTELRSSSLQVDVATSAPTDTEAGRTYFDTSTGILYVYAGGAWKSAQFTTTSTT